MKRTNKSYLPSIYVLILVFLSFKTLYSQQHETDTTLLAEVYLEYDLKNYNRTMDLIAEGMLVAMAEQDSSSIVNYSFIKSKVFQQREQLDSMVNTLIFSYLYASTPENIVKINFQLGELLLKIGSYDLAIPYLKELVENEENLTSKFYHYNLLGQAYQFSGQKENCIQNFKEQLHVAETLKDDFLIANAKNNQGYIYFYFKNYKTAKPILEEVIRYFETKDSLQTKDKEILLNAKLTLSSVFYQQQEFQNCISFFEESLSLYGEPFPGFSNYQNYVQSLLLLNEEHKVKTVLSSLQSISNSIENESILSRYYLYYYFHTKRYKNLEEEYDRFTKIQQKVNNIQNQEHQNKLDLLGHFYLTTAKNNLEIETIKYDKLIQEKKNTEFIFKIGIAMFLLILCFIVGYYFEKQKRNRLEKELILKEKENLNISLQLQRKDLSKASIDVQERSRVMNEFLSKFKNVNSLEPKLVKEKIVEELKTLKQFNASRKTLDKILLDNTNVNTAFHHRLLKLHPDLTQNDINLCSYLLLGLSTKDIANLQGILPSSVRMNKMRMKKKMKLNNQSIEDYLINITL